jgi:hypothetical protein
LNRKLCRSKFLRNANHPVREPPNRGPRARRARPLRGASRKNWHETAEGRW